MPLSPQWRIVGGQSTWLKPTTLRRGTSHVLIVEALDAMVGVATTTEQRNMVLITFEHNGQAFDRDVGIYDLTREDLEASIKRCKSVESVDVLWELVDGEEYDAAVYEFLKLFEDWLTHDRDDVYLYFTGDNNWLVYFGPDEHFGAVVGSIMALRYGKGDLLEDVV